MFTNVSFCKFVPFNHSQSHTETRLKFKQSFFCGSQTLTYRDQNKALKNTELTIHNTQLDTVLLKMKLNQHF